MNANCSNLETAIAFRRTYFIHCISSLADGFNKHLQMVFVTTVLSQFVRMKEGDNIFISCFLAKLLPVHKIVIM
jgi:hypothetical protein